MAEGPAFLQWDLILTNYTASDFTFRDTGGQEFWWEGTERIAKEEDGEEIVTYDHLCKNCHHVIARHEYTFSIMDEFQEYTMLCLLCGKAEDTISILPDDPRQMTLLF